MANRKKRPPKLSPEETALASTIDTAARTRVIEALMRGATILRACEEAGVHPMALAQAARVDPEFQADIIDAMEVGTSELEELLLETARMAPPNSMARVRALETLLKGRSNRYRDSAPIRSSLAPIQLREAEAKGYPQLDT